MTQSPYRIGCSGIPTGLHRDRYFQKLNFLECPETFANPPRIKVLRSWARASEGGDFGLIASRVISHQSSEGYDELPEEQWAEAGGYRDTPVVRAAVERMKEQVLALGASTVLFRTPSDLSRSAEGKLRTFFSEIATTETCGGATRIWEPGNLWEVPASAKLAAELGLVLAVDPFAESPLAGTAPRPIDELDRAQDVYMRVRGLGRARGGFRDHELEELAEITQEFQRAWVVFANRDKNRDAKKLVGYLAS